MDHGMELLFMRRDASAVDSGVVVTEEERQWTVELLLHKVNHICIYSRLLVAVCAGCLLELAADCFLFSALRLPFVYV